jgi:hypothetical protein
MRSTLAACIEILSPQSASERARAQQLSDDDAAAPSATKDAFVQRMRQLAGSFSTDLMADGAVESLVIGGATFMLDVTLCDEAANGFVSSVNLSYVSADGQSQHSHEPEQAMLLDLLRRGVVGAISRWFLSVRRAEEWAAQLKVDVRQLLAVLEEDVAKLAAACGDALVGQIATLGPTGVGLAYCAPSRSLHFVMEYLADAQPIALPLQSQLVPDFARAADAAFFSRELLGAPAANCRLRYVACLSQPVPMTIEALQGLLFAARVGGQPPRPHSGDDGGQATVLQLLYTLRTKRPPPVDAMLETVTSGRRQRFVINFGSGAPALLVQRVPIAHASRVVPLVATLRQLHVVHEILSSLLIAPSTHETADAPKRAEVADVFEVSHLPPDRIVVHLSAGTASAPKLVALVVRVDLQQRISCELSGVDIPTAQLLAAQAESLLAAARSLPDALAQIVPLLASAPSGELPTERAKRTSEAVDEPAPTDDARKRSRA